MYQQFKLLYENYIVKKDHTHHYVLTEFLKRIKFFQNQASTYGTDVLSYYLPLLQPQFLHQNTVLMASIDQYIIIEGLIRVDMQQTSQMNNKTYNYCIYSDGMFLDTSKNIEKITILKDTSMVKLDTSSKMMKKSLMALRKFEKQRLNRSRQFQKLLLTKKQMIFHLDKLKDSQLFRSIGEYDINELLIKSDLKFLSKNSKTHSNCSQVKQIIYIIQGTIKINHLNQVNYYNDIIKQKYLIHKKNQKPSRINFIQQKQFIGIQEHLQNQCFHSQGVVVSHDAVLLMIPVSIFDKKINQKSCYHAYCKLKRLIENKKAIVDRNVACKKQKQQQIMYQYERSKILKKYQQQKSSKDRMKSENKNNKSKHSNSMISYPQQCYMPEVLSNKIKVYEQKYFSLPKIKQKISLFPEQYEKAMVPLQLKQKMKMAEASLKGDNFHERFKPKKSIKSSNMSPKTIRQKFLFQNLHIKSKLYSDGSFKSCQIVDNPEGNVTQQCKSSRNKNEYVHTKYHHNRSIYNNFKADGSKTKIIFNFQKTLQIK